MCKVVSITLYIHVFGKVCHPSTHLGLCSLVINTEHSFSLRWTRTCLFSVIMQSFSVLYHRQITALSAVISNTVHENCGCWKWNVALLHSPMFQNSWSSFAPGCLQCLHIHSTVLVLSKEGPYLNQHQQVVVSMIHFLIPLPPVLHFCMHTNLLYTHNSSRQRKIFLHMSISRPPGTFSTNLLHRPTLLETVTYCAISFAKPS